MQTILILTGVILLIAFLSFIYKFFNVLDISKKKKKETEVIVGKSNTINAFLFILFFLSGTLGLLYYSFNGGIEGLLPEAVSVQGKQSDFLFWFVMIIVLAGLFIVFLLLFTFPFLYRYRPNRKASYYNHNTKLELFWTIIPSLGLIVMLFYGLKLWNEFTDLPKENDPDLYFFEVMGKQFNWQVRYPGKDGVLGSYDFRKIDAINSMGVDFKDQASMDDFIPREIHMPKGKKILLKIRSRDVIHSVYLPHFRIKMDAVPGMPTQIWFKPTKTTEEMRRELKNPDFNYELACAEVCGIGHFGMRMIVVVDELNDYNKWVSQQESWAGRNQDYLKSIGIDYQEKNKRLVTKK